MKTERVRRLSPGAPNVSPVKELDMNNLNTVLIEGQLTRDPTWGNSPAQTQMCKLSIANNRYYLDRKGEWQQDPAYFNIHVYGNVASACVAHLRKGRGIRVVGTLKQFSWKDNGIWREKIYILAEHIEFQPVKKAEQTNAPNELGGFETRANLKDIEDLPSDAAASEPVQEPTVPPADAPECTIESMGPEDDIQDSQSETYEDSGQEDYEQVSGL